MLINSISISNPYQYQNYNYEKSLNTNPQSSNAPINSGTSTKEIQPGEICQTCKERKYQDGSDDPSVSFKTAGHIAPEDSAVVVKNHEMEHVANEQASAKSEGKEVVSQSVSLQTSTCPECGKTYVSGGTTKTTTKSEAQLPFNLGESNLKGNNVDEVV